MFVVSYFLVKAAVPAVVFVSVYMGPAAWNKRFVRSISDLCNNFYWRGRPLYNAVSKEYDIHHVHI